MNARIRGGEKLASHPCGKTRYPSRALAKKFAKWIGSRMKAKFRAYICPRCDGWHLTTRVH